VGAIETVHSYLRDAATDGVAVLVISEDLDEIRALADRIVVLYEGRVAGECDPEATSVEAIGLLMAGGGGA
jgi:simple sugar transport system ATP-binding protein